MGNSFLYEGVCFLRVLRDLGPLLALLVVPCHAAQTVHTLSRRGHTRPAQKPHITLLAGLYLAVFGVGVRQQGNNIFPPMSILCREHSRTVCFNEELVCLSIRIHGFGVLSKFVVHIPFDDGHGAIRSQHGARAARRRGLPGPGTRAFDRGQSRASCRFHPSLAFPILCKSPTMPELARNPQRGPVCAAFSPPATASRFSSSWFGCSWLEQGDGRHLCAVRGGVGGQILAWSCVRQACCVRLGRSQDHDERPPVVRCSSFPRFFFCVFARIWHSGQVALWVLSR